MFRQIFYTGWSSCVLFFLFSMWGRLLCFRILIFRRHGLSKLKLCLEVIFLWFIIHQVYLIPGPESWQIVHWFSLPIVWYLIIIRLLNERNYPNIGESDGTNKDACCIFLLRGRVYHAPTPYGNRWLLLDVMKLPWSCRTLGCVSSIYMTIKVERGNVILI